MTQLDQAALDQAALDQAALDLPTLSGRRHDPGVRESRRFRLRTVAFAVGSLVVLGLAVAFAVLVLRDGQPATAQEAAEAYVEAYNSRDGDALEELLCTPQKRSAELLALAADRSGTELRLLGPVEQAGAAASARVALLEGGKDTGERFTLDLVSRAQGWTVCSSG